MLTLLSYGRHSWVPPVNHEDEEDFFYHDGGDGVRHESQGGGGQTQVEAEAVPLERLEAAAPVASTGTRWSALHLL